RHPYNAREPFACRLLHLALSPLSSLPITVLYISPPFAAQPSSSRGCPPRSTPALIAVRPQNERGAASSLSAKAWAEPSSRITPQSSTVRTSKLEANST